MSSFVQGWIGALRGTYSDFRPTSLLYTSCTVISLPLAPSHRRFIIVLHTVLTQQVGGVGASSITLY